METAYVTTMADGQIGLSTRLLKYLGLEAGEKVRIQTENRQIIVTPVRSVADELWGTIKLDHAQIQKVLDIEEWELWKSRQESPWMKE